HLYAGLTALGFRTTETVSPIIPVLIGDADMATRMADRLFQSGVYAPAIRPPTVPRQSSRIRVTVTSEHSREQLDTVLVAFQNAGRTLGLL
ncbi:MAG: aminotransferase class I/II-fold pyridoxal phosphate-dependent enzyme, partial [Nitrospiraceae bacterium]